MAKADFNLEELLKTKVHPDMPEDMFALQAGRRVHLFKVKGEKTIGPIKLSPAATRIFLSKLVSRDGT